MNKGILLKVIILIILINILLNIFSLSVSNAVGDIFTKGKEFLSEGETVSTTIDTEQLKKTSDYIYNILLAMAIIIAIIVAMVLGIQFMAASADEKAKVKEAIIPFVVGCIVVFGAFTIWKIAIQIGNSAEESAEEIVIDRDEGKPNNEGTLTFEGEGGNVQYIIPAE